jgi:hypothetical protein
MQSSCRLRSIVNISIVMQATSTLTFLAYFPEMKVGLSNHLSVSVSPTNNIWTTW